jgi:hypothetical protein
MVAAEAGANDTPSWPSSSVVTPWRSAASWVSLADADASACTWVSTKPGIR